MRWLLRSHALAGLLLALSVVQAAAQLRPLHPMDWDLFDGDHTATARLGGSVLLDQRASLAGTQGRLLEIGDFALSMRSGRIAVQVGGTVLRLFEDQETLATPFGGARESTGEARRDVGDFRVSTVILLTPPQRDASAALRFGTRLPTTDNEVGLERDRTDFFALLGGRVRSHGYMLAAEAGVGINGTHDSRLEQSDVLMYSATTGYDAGFVSPRASVVGHFDGMSGLTIRGNEELAELRLGARVGGDVWAEADVVYGLQPFSPRTGFIIFAGYAW